MAAPCRWAWIPRGCVIWHLPANGTSERPCLIRELHVDCRCCRPDRHSARSASEQPRGDSSGASAGSGGGVILRCGILRSRSRSPCVVPLGLHRRETVGEDPLDLRDGFTRAPVEADRRNLSRSQPFAALVAARSFAHCPRRHLARLGSVSVSRRAGVAVPAPTTRTRSRWRHARGTRPRSMRCPYVALADYGRATSRCPAASSRSLDVGVVACTMTGSAMLTSLARRPQYRFARAADADGCPSSIASNRASQRALCVLAASMLMSSPRSRRLRVGCLVGGRFVAEGAEVGDGFGGGCGRAVVLIPRGRSARRQGARWARETLRARPMTPGTRGGMHSIRATNSCPLVGLPCIAVSSPHVTDAADVAGVSVAQSNVLPVWTVVGRMLRRWWLSTRGQPRGRARGWRCWTRRRPTRGRLLRLVVARSARFLAMKVRSEACGQSGRMTWKALAMRSISCSFIVHLQSQWARRP